MSNIFVKVPKRGDIVVKDIATKTPQYISQESFVLADIDTTQYEIIGVVYHRDGKDVGVVYKENASKKWCSRAWWYLSGYTLDGTPHTGVLSLRFASNSWASSIDKTIAYASDNMEDFLKALNDTFNEDEDMNGQGWKADLYDGKVRLSCNNIDYRQCSSNSAKSGFSLTGSIPEIKYLANIRRKHGGKGGEGAISNWDRALAYFRQDQSSTSYNPTSVVTSIKTTYPVCLPAYLGTSTQSGRTGNECKLLRDTYGNSEAGWLKYMTSCLPVVPCDNGNMTFEDGSERTKILASFEIDDTPMCDAASYCNGKTSVTVDKGEFYLPTTKEVYQILDGVHYGTNSSRNSDALNKGLNLIGGSAISNGSYLWSCCRYLTNLAWFAYGGGGFFRGVFMYSSYTAVPVSLYKIA